MGLVPLGPPFSMETRTSARCDPSSFSLPPFTSSLHTLPGFTSLPFILLLTFLRSFDLSILVTHCKFSPLPSTPPYSLFLTLPIIHPYLILISLHFFFFPFLFPLFLFTCLAIPLILFKLMTHLSAFLFLFRLCALPFLLVGA